MIALRRPKGVCLALVVLLSALLQLAAAASSWGFSDATVSITSKGSGVSGGLKEKLTERKALAQPVTLRTADTLKIILTTQEGRSAKRAHQSFLLLRDPISGLDVSYPFSVKDNGKAKLDLTQKDIPSQLIRSSAAIDANIIIGSFGSSTPYNDMAFQLSIDLDPNTPIDTATKPLRYGKLPEIHHTFRADPKSPNILLSMIFVGAVITTIPALLGLWLYLGVNLSQLSSAMKDAPGAHLLFYGSIVGMEGVFFMYYTTWNLFQTLPVIFAIGTVTFLSGSRALTEVQERRLAGLR